MIISHQVCFLVNLGQRIGVLGRQSSVLFHEQGEGRRVSSRCIVSIGLHLYDSKDNCLPKACHHSYKICIFLVHYLWCRWQSSLGTLILFSQLLKVLSSDMGMSCTVVLQAFRRPFLLSKNIFGFVQVCSSRNDHTLFGHGLVTASWPVSEYSPQRPQEGNDDVPPIL